MEPILFYGVPEGCSFGSIVALEWAGRPYRLCRIEMPHETETEAFRRLNPLSETPAFIDERGQVLHQSLAILHHIAASAPEKKLGAEAGTREFDRLNEMLSFLVTTYFSSYAPLWLTVEGADEADRPVLRKVGIERVEKAHAQLERLLGDRTWLMGGERPTIADAYFFGVARWNDFHKAVDRSAYPGLHRLFERLRAEPAVQFALAIEHQEAAVSAGGFRGHVGLDEAVGALKAAA